MEKQISLKAVGGILAIVISLFVVMNHWNSYVASPSMVTGVDKKYEEKMKTAMNEVKDVEEKVSETNNSVKDIQIKQEGFSKDIDYLKKQSEIQNELSQKILEAVQSKE